MTKEIELRKHAQQIILDAGLPQDAVDEGDFFNEKHTFIHDLPGQVEAVLTDWHILSKTKEAQMRNPRGNEELALREKIKAFEIECHKFYAPTPEQLQNEEETYL